MKLITAVLYICLIIFVLLRPDASGGQIENTKHNLSITGPGSIRAVSEDRICIFCHAPDRTRAKVDFLWNKKMTKRHYIPYKSSTLYAKVGQPTGSSKLCLSCHDGTIALGDVLSERREIEFAGGFRFIPEGPQRIGTDLSDDHPVSFIYDSALAIANGELADPLALHRDVKLDKDKQLQCTSCHDPHNNMYGKFLVMDNESSALCRVCHRKDGWNVTSHASSTARWNGKLPDPWPDTAYDTVAQNGCNNCHTMHSAAGRERLLHYAYEEDNCLVCHNGNIADLDIETELTKPYRHSVQDYTGVHDPAENLSGDIEAKDVHVECFDCHNPHWSNPKKPPLAEGISGSLQGTAGIDVTGGNVQYATYEYEICYKCHGDYNMLSVLPVSREVEQLNVKLEFNPANPSFHPVTAKGKNQDMPSLVPPYSPASIIACTDCHNNDDKEGPRGPHGSNNKFLLEKNYTIDDFTEEDPFNYALCYKCHDRTSILSDESFSSHKLHIVDEQSPCSACHDPHGISATQGNSVNNSHLINFNLTIVQPSSGGMLSYDDTGIFSGKCSLSCHGSDHNQRVYP